MDLVQLEEKLKNLQNELDCDIKDLCDDLINHFYNIGIGDKTVSSIQNHYDELTSLSNYIFKEIIKLIKESK